MSLRLKKSVNNKPKEKAMLRLKASEPTKRPEEKHVTNLDMEAYRQAQIGLDASMHALYASTDDVARKEKLVDIMKHIRKTFADANARYGLKDFNEDDLLPLPDDCLSVKSEVIPSRKIQADRVVDMDDLALELAMVLDFNPARLNTLFKKVKNAIENAPTQKEQA